eukprot:11157798-Lingulodinium_polyedra.AAC.1
MAGAAPSPSRLGIPSARSRLMPSALRTGRTTPLSMPANTLPGPRSFDVPSPLRRAPPGFATATAFPRVALERLAR